MEISEVKQILGLCHAFRAPKHIIITDEPISEMTAQGRQFYRGLQPVSRRDVIVLSGQADVTTIPHENFHRATGLGEMLAYPYGFLAAKKVEIMSRFPLLTSLRMRELKYVEVPNPPEFPQLAEFEGRVRHYQLA